MATDLDSRACALGVARSCWPDREWDVQLVTRKVRPLDGGAEVLEESCRPVGVRSDRTGWMELDLTNFSTVLALEAVAIERGLEFLYGKFLHEELPPEQGAHHAGVQWARAPLDARIRALYRVFTHEPLPIAP